MNEFAGPITMIGFMSGTVGRKAGVALYEKFGDRIPKRFRRRHVLVAFEVTGMLVGTFGTMVPLALLANRAQRCEATAD